MFHSGYLTLARIRGTPIRVHWTTPIGAFVLTGLSFVPGAWLGFALLVLAHEAGHALLVRAFRYRVASIDVHGVGGECRYWGEPTETQRAVIAWGGVLAQLVVLFTTPLWASHLSPETTPFVAQLVSAFTGTNVLLIAFNLLPVRPLDGAEAWELFRPSRIGRFGRTLWLTLKAKRIRRKLDTVAKEKKHRASGQETGKVIPFPKAKSKRSDLH